MMPRKNVSSPYTLLTPFRASRSSVTSRDPNFADRSEPMRCRSGASKWQDRDARKMVPLAGLEPARCFHHLILSQARLPLPPQGHARDHNGRPGGVNAHTLAPLASLYGAPSPPTG